MIVILRYRLAFPLLVLLFGFAAPSAPVSAQMMELDEPPLAKVTTVPDVARILPGDSIALRVWREPEWSGQFGVDDRGIAVLPRLGPMMLSGLTVSEARVMLSERFSEYLVTPAVEVTVLRKVAILGEVRAPNLYWVDPTATVGDLIAMAGGLTFEGHPNKIFLRRGPQDVPVNETDRFAAPSIELESGDQLFVERKSWLALNTGFVVSTFVGASSIVLGLLLSK